MTTKILDNGIVASEVIYSKYSNSTTVTTDLDIVIKTSDMDDCLIFGVVADKCQVKVTFILDQDIQNAILEGNEYDAVIGVGGVIDSLAAPVKVTGETRSPIRAIRFKVIGVDTGAKVTYEVRYCI